MTREEILGALNEMFPDGIPDSCNEIMAREDAPFKSYQELRKAMSRSPAYTNRANWKALVSDEEGGEVEPPKPELKFSIDVQPEELHNKGDTATVSILTEQGEFDPSSVTVALQLISPIDPETNPFNYGISVFDPTTSTSKITYVEESTSGQVEAALLVSAVDKYSGKQVSAGSLVVLFSEGKPKETKISWELTRDTLTHKDDEVFANYTILSGEEPDQIWIDFPEDLPESLARLVNTSSVYDENKISITCNSLAEEEDASIPLTLFSIKQGSGASAPTNHGTLNVTVVKTTADKLELTWEQDVEEISDTTDSVMIETTLVKGQYQSGSLEVSLVDSNDLEYVTPGVKIGNNPIPLTVKKVPEAGQPDKVVKFIVVAVDENYPSKGRQQFGGEGQFTIKAKQGAE